MSERRVVNTGDAPLVVGAHSRATTNGDRAARIAMTAPNGADADPPAHSAGGGDTVERPAVATVD
jgi:hypothetical protein